MTLYWIFLVIGLVLIVWSENSYRRVYCANHWEMRGTYLQGLVLFVPLIFFCGLRSGIADTGTYITEFEAYPSNFSDVVFEELGKGKLFGLFGVFYKHFISEDFHGWLFIIAMISATFVLIGIKRYSAFFGMSLFLFIASTEFVYLINGMRQFIAISVIFAFSNLIVEKKLFKFLILIGILAFIHSSVLIMIPVYFIIQSKPFGTVMKITVILSMIAGVMFDFLWSHFGSVLEGTEYEGYIDYMANGTGVNVIRVFVAAVPLIIALWGRRALEEQEYPLVRVCINMTTITFCLYLVALFSSGMAVGRALAYFEIYNIITLPWLIKQVFEKNSSRFVAIVCIIAYIIFFYFQMVVAWSSLGYESDILNLYL